MLAASMLMACICISAFAEDAAETESNIIIEYDVPDVIVTDVLTDEGVGNLLARARTTYSLGNSGSMYLTIANFLAESTRTTSYNYSTNSTKIKITMKSDISFVVKVALYDASNNTMIGVSTFTVKKTNTSITFTNLTSSKNYYIKFTKLGQQDVNVTGTISAT